MAPLVCTASGITLSYFRRISHDSSVSQMTGYRTNKWCVIPGRGEDLFFGQPKKIIYRNVNRARCNTGIEYQMRHLMLPRGAAED